MKLIRVVDSPVKRTLPFTASRLWIGQIRDRAHVLAGVLAGLSNGRESLAAKISPLVVGRCRGAVLRCRYMSRDEHIREAAHVRDHSPRTLRRVHRLSLASRPDRHSLSSQGEVLEVELDAAEPQKEGRRSSGKVVRTGRFHQQQLDQRNTPAGPDSGWPPWCGNTSRGHP